jgi:hypothetical protein
MNKPHFAAVALPILRRGSALPRTDFRIFVDHKVALLPMVFATADPDRL